MSNAKSYFSIFTSLLVALLAACDGGETVECDCSGETCICPDDLGLEKVEVFVTYKLNEEAPETGMEVMGTYTLMYTESEEKPVACENKRKDSTTDLQCSLGYLPLTSEIHFMVMIPSEGDELEAACLTPHRSECRGTLLVQMFPGGRKVTLEDMLVTDGDFPGYVSYRVRLEEK